METNEFQEQVLSKLDAIDQKIDCKVDGLRDDMNGKFAALTSNLIRSGTLKPGRIMATSEQGLDT